MLIPKRITTGYGAVVTITGKLAHWDNVLTTWVTEMERLSDAFVFPIYDLFRERANFSILAQAANRTPDYAAVPETKDFNGKKGFYDFLLQHPRGIDVAEGKFGWFNMPALGKVGGGEVGDALTEADLEMKDRIRVGHWVASKVGVANYVAVAFGCVGCTVPDTEKELRCQIEDTVGQFRSVDCDALAYCFPKRCITVEGEHYNNWIGAGGVVIVRKLRQS